jgi:ankyrin repeat protein
LLTNEKYFKANLKNQEGNTALMIATNNGNVKKMKLFLQKENPNSFNKNGDSPLIIAVKNNYKEAVKLLLNPKYNVDLEQGQNYTGFTAIYFASKAPFLGKIKESQIKILKMLLDSGANPNIRYDESNNSPPLIISVKQGE